MAFSDIRVVITPKDANWLSLSLSKALINMRGVGRFQNNQAPLENSAHPQQTQSPKWWIHQFLLYLWKGKQIFKYIEHFFILKKWFREKGKWPSLNNIHAHYLGGSAGQCLLPFPLLQKQVSPGMFTKMIWLCNTGINLRNYTI